MVKDIFSKKEINGFGKYYGDEKPKKLKIKRSIFKSPEKQKVEEKPEEDVNYIKPTVKRNPIRFNFRGIFIIILIVVLIAGIVYIDSNSFIIKKTPKEKAEHAAKSFADIEIAKNMRVKDVRAAEKEGYSSSVTHSYINNGTWYVGVKYDVRIKDLISNNYITMKNSVILHVNSTNYDVTPPGKWK